MELGPRLRLIVLGAALTPVGLFYVCAAWFGADLRTAMGAAAAAALPLTYAAAGVVVRGLAAPLEKAAAAVRAFLAGDHKLESPLVKEGWPEAETLISVLNRVLLELNAYRAFHLNQVVEERAKAQALLETVTDGVLLLDDRGRLMYSNRYARDILRLSGGGEDVVLPGDAAAPEFSPALRGIIASSEKVTRTEVSAGTADEGPPPRVFRLVSRRFPLATLKRPGLVIMIRDVTMEKEIESARETFFHMITHDMRAPICSIQGYAQLMRGEVETLPGADRCLRAIMRSSDRLKGMVEDILNIIKLERGEMPLRAGAIDAEDLCRRVYELHEPLASRRGIAFSLAPVAGKVVFKGDAALLERVAANLVGNALKFTPHGGKVVLSCGDGGREILFAVEDDGPGVPPELREEIFRKHAQMSEHRHMGFGLGLAMCRMAVELHGGRVWVSAGKAGGAVFSFTVPKGEGHA